MNLNRTLNYKLVRQLSLSASEFQKTNYYDCLGITPKATQGDVKSAYYKLSKEYHPDLNRGNTDAADKFRNITEAYEVLGNLKSRKLYDRGIFIGGHEQSFKSEEPVKDNYEHSSFYHHRNKPVNKQNKSTSTPHYDIDEWTRAHYSNTFNQKNERKSESVRSNMSIAKENEEMKSILQVVLLLTCFSIACLFQYIHSEKRYDVPLSSISKPEDKPN